MSSTKRILFPEEYSLLDGKMTKEQADIKFSEDAKDDDVDLADSED